MEDILWRMLSSLFQKKYIILPVMFVSVIKWYTREIRE